MYVKVPATNESFSNLSHFNDFLKFLLLRTTDLGEFILMVEDHQIGFIKFTDLECR